jgi:hypothetical protein
LDRLVALKILSSGSRGGAAFAERFSREARALARLTHPNIVSVYESGQAGELLYFVMEYVDGLNLRQLQRAQPLSPREALRIIPQLCDALQYAHDQGVVHRDIKPENVLIDRKGCLKIADFGLAKIFSPDVVASHLTLADERMGTPHYMAPEQVECPSAVDHRADIYSMGVVFYELLTGELPLGKFEAPSRRVEIDVRLDDIVLRTLEKAPERRYQQAGLVKEEVETVVARSAARPDSRSHFASVETNPPWYAWYPFQSREVEDICTHLGGNERRQVLFHFLLQWAWIVLGGFLVSVALLSSHYRGAGMARGLLVFLVHLAAMPIWRRYYLRLLKRTERAQSRYSMRWPVPLFSFRRGFISHRPLRVSLWILLLGFFPFVWWGIWEVRPSPPVAVMPDFDPYFSGQAGGATATQAPLQYSPVLGYVVWQDGKTPQSGFSATTSIGEEIQAKAELRFIGSTLPKWEMEGSETVRGSGSRRLILYFFHPEFVHETSSMLSIRDWDSSVTQEGQIISAASPRFGSGCLIYSVNFRDSYPDRLQSFPLNVVLEYGIGPWKETDTVKASIEGVAALGNQGQFAAGQSASGKAFASLVINGPTDVAPYYGVIAQSMDGRRLEAASSNVSVRGATQIYRFNFTEGLGDINDFQVRTRPRQTANFELVLVPSQGVVHPAPPSAERISLWPTPNGDSSALNRRF